MDAPSPPSPLFEKLDKYKLELCCIGLTTLAFQAYRMWKNRRDEKMRSSLKSRLIKKKTKMFQQFKYDKQYQIPKEILQSENALVDEIKYLASPICKIERVPNLLNTLEHKAFSTIRSPLMGDNKYRSVFGGQGFLPQQSFVYKGSFVLSKNIYDNAEQFSNPTLWLLAGPRKDLYFKPKDVKAAIVTCGGLCPGLNVVIREIFVTLSILYGVPEVWGVHFGYMGFYEGNWERLTLDAVKTLQYIGGTVLASPRGGFDAKKIIDSVEQRGINQVYIIGGDGTHKGILALCEELEKRKSEIVVIGIPKTIDNDIPIIDKSFGFETAVSEAIRAIRSAYVQSRGVNFGIGLVRLMGRDAGFIAMEATNASRDVDVCLIPEFQFDLYGEFGVLEYVYKELKQKKHLVVVVAEGAGSAVRDLEALGQAAERDMSGNIKRPVTNDIIQDIGVFLKTEIVKYCKGKGLDATLKYIDPTYMIRTVPANSYDRKMCAHLASSAVHGAMAGFTAFTVGYINSSPAMIPIRCIGSPNRVTSSNRAWQRVLASTSQPFFLN